MKKLFQRIDHSAKESHPTHSSFMGKVFVVGKHNVTVEDIIAEGMPYLLQKDLTFEHLKAIIWVVLLIFIN